MTLLSECMVQVLQTSIRMSPVKVQLIHASFLDHDLQALHWTQIRIFSHASDTVLMSDSPCMYFFRETHFPSVHIHYHSWQYRKLYKAGWGERQRTSWTGCQSIEEWDPFFCQIYSVKRMNFHIKHGQLFFSTFSFASWEQISQQRLTGIKLTCVP